MAVIVLTVFDVSLQYLQPRRRGGTTRLCGRGRLRVMNSSCSSQCSWV